MGNGTYCDKVRENREDAKQRHEKLLQKNEELKEEKKMGLEKAIERLTEKAEFTYEDILIGRKFCRGEMEKLIEDFERTTESQLLGLDSHIAHLMSRLENLHKDEVEYRHQMEAIKTVKWAAKEEE